VAAALGHRLPVLDPPGRQEPGRRVATPTAPAGTTGRSAPHQAAGTSVRRRGWPRREARSRCPHCTDHLAQIRATVTAVGYVAAEDLDPLAWADLIDLYRRWRAGTWLVEAPRPTGSPARSAPRPGTAGGPWASGTTGWAVEGPSSEQGWPRARRLVGRSGGGDGRGARPVGRV